MVAALFKGISEYLDHLGHIEAHPQASELNFHVMIHDVVTAATHAERENFTSTAFCEFKGVPRQPFVESVRGGDALLTVGVNMTDTTGRSVAQVLIAFEEVQRRIYHKLIVGVCTAELTDRVVDYLTA